MERCVQQWNEQVSSLFQLPEVSLPSKSCFPPTHSWLPLEEGSLESFSVLVGSFSAARAQDLLQDKLLCPATIPFTTSEQTLL